MFGAAGFSSQKAYAINNLGYGTNSKLRLQFSLFSRPGDQLALSWPGCSWFQELVPKVAGVAADHHTAGLLLEFAAWPGSPDLRP